MWHSKINNVKHMLFDNNINDTVKKQYKIDNYTNIVYTSKNHKLEKI